MSFDPRRFKAQERAGFNRIAHRYAAGAHLRQSLADALLDAAQLQAGEWVLDLASGPGLLALPAAAAVAPHGGVIATDIAEAMLGAARAQARDAAATTLLCAVSDAEHLCLPDARIDCVLAGLALFMFPHPERALAEAWRVLKPGGRLLLSVWGPASEVPLIGCAQEAIAACLPPPKVPRPSVFRFGDDAVLAQALQQAGFTLESISPCCFDCTFRSCEEYWQAFMDLAGGAAEALARQPPAELARIIAQCEQTLSPFAQGAGYRVPAQGRIAHAIKA